MEFDRVVYPFFDFRACVDKGLNGRGVNMGAVKECVSPQKRRFELRDLHRAEVQNDSMEAWFLEIGFLVFSAGPSLSVVIPWTVTGLHMCHVLTSSILGLDFVNKGRVDVRAVGIQVTLLAAVDDDARHGRGNLDVRVCDTIFGERHVDFASVSLSIGCFVDCHPSQEAVPWMRQANKE